MEWLQWLGVLIPFAVVALIVAIAALLDGVDNGITDDYANNYFRPFNVPYDWGYVYGIWYDGRPLKDRMARNRKAFEKRMGVHRADND